LPEVLAAAAAQQLSPLFFPTYASWLNPIEKLWRWLKQDVLHVHNLAHNLDELRRLVAAFLDPFRLGSSALLRYVGLWSILD
jgi:transposase